MIAICFKDVQCISSLDQLLNPRPLGRGRLTYLIGTHATLLCVVKVRLSTFVYLPFYVAGQCFLVKKKKKKKACVHVHEGPHCKTRKIRFDQFSGGAIFCDQQLGGFRSNLT